MKRLLILATLTVFSASVTRADTKVYDYTVKVINSEKSLASPLTATGTCSIHEQILPDNSVSTEWRMDISLTNMSSKEILAYEFSLDLISDHGAKVRYIQQADYIFTPELIIKPGAVDPLDFDPHSTMVTPHETTPFVRQANATINVLFVQFSDGTKYGRSKWSDNLHAYRTTALERLKSLSDAYQTGERMPYRTAWPL